MTNKISVADIQKLRDLTGAGVMECKRALADAEGDFDEAVKLVRERGAARIEKRSDREAGAGLIETYVHNGRIGVMLDLRAETDFVVRSETFRKLARELAMQIAAGAPRNVEELIKQPYIRDEKRTIDDIVKEVATQVGETVKVNTFYRIEL